MNQAIDNALNDVRNAFPSIYSKDDVVTILEALKEHVNESVSIDKERLKARLEDVIDRASRNFDEDIISDVEFRIAGSNEVEIASCDIDTSNISSVIYEAVEEAIDEMIPDAE